MNKPKTITISGQARHGKNVTAEILKEKLIDKNQRVIIINYADYLKYLAKQYYGWNGEKNEKSGDNLTVDQIIDWELTQFVLPEWRDRIFSDPDKAKWIRKNLPFFDINNFIPCYYKHKIKTDIMVDDGAHNFHNFKGTKCLIDRPWNQKFTQYDYCRFNNLFEVRGYLDSSSEEIEMQIKIPLLNC